MPRHNIFFGSTVIFIHGMVWYQNSLFWQLTTKLQIFLPILKKKKKETLRSSKIKIGFSQQTQNQQRKIPYWISRGKAQFESMYDNSYLGKVWQGIISKPAGYFVCQCTPSRYRLPQIYIFISKTPFSSNSEPKLESGHTQFCFTSLEYTLIKKWKKKKYW